MRFTVVDVETTGLFVNAHDRIVEISLIQLTPQGQVADEYTTLLNPKRDLGPTHLHGITAKHVAGAPEFKEIVGDIAARIRSSILVGHNVGFDVAFLRVEFHRSGCSLPELPFLCTMHLAGRILPALSSRKLEVCCAHLGIPLDGSHSAQLDAHATATVFATFLKRVEEWKDKLAECAAILDRSLTAVWPNIPPSGKSWPRSTAAKAAERCDSYISNLIEKLPRMTSREVRFDAYFDLLDRALEDRRLTREEAEALIELGMKTGLSREQLLAAHRQYMKDLALAALADGIVAEREKWDLYDVAALLCIPKADVDTLLTTAKAIRYGTPKPSIDRGFVGETVCFTGSFTCRVRGEIPERDFAERLAQEKGMVVKKSVTKALDYLVAADPDSMSGKAQKARKYGVRIIGEPVFWRMMGVDFQ